MSSGHHTAILQTTRLQCGRTLPSPSGLMLRRLCCTLEMPGSDLAWHQLFPLMFDVAFLGARGTFWKCIAMKPDSYYSACHVAVKRCVCVCVIKRVNSSKVLKAR